MATTDEHRRRTRTTRMVAVGAVVGAFVALIGVGVLGFLGGSTGGGAGLGGLGSGGGSGGSGSGQEPATTTTTQPLDAPAESCLTWTELDASDADRVDCSEPHLFEVTGTVDLRPDFGDRSPFPADEVWRQLITDECSTVSQLALANQFDPFGRFSVGAIKPSADLWDGGQRMLRCGLQASGRSGALYATTGRVLDQDQSDVHEIGSCLGNDGRGVGDPVECTEPHAVEIVGVVNLSAAFPQGYPDEAAQDMLLSEECTRLATEYAGGPEVVGEQGLTVFWETLRAESWEAGSMRVDCRLAAFLPDRSGFAPVTGSVRAGVQVGTEPAPAAETAEGPAPTTLVPVPDASTPGPPAPPPG